MCRSSRIFAYIFILSLMQPSFLLRAQSPTQTAGGKITEQNSRVLPPGVNVIVVGADVLFGGSTNKLANLLITSGNESVPEMGLQELLISRVGVVITSLHNKSQIANNMALTGDASADLEKSV
jgi:hypothetical protein